MSDSTIAPPITAAPNGATVASGDGTAANLGDGNSAANNASAADPQVVMPEGQASPVPAVSAQSFAAGAAAAVIPAAAPADTTVAKSAPLPPVMDLNNPEFYLNRELTWLAFNWRVLAEAEDRRNPLLERLKFLAITGSNLDEFFMKRIGGLKQQVVAGVLEMTPDGRTPRQQISECYADIRRFEQRQREVLKELIDALKEYDVRLVTYEELTDEQRTEVREHYVKNIFPLVTPLAMDPAHPFPFVSNLSHNLLVSLRDPVSGDQLIARIKVPLGAGIPRFIRAATSVHFVPLEDVIAHNLDMIFPNMMVEACEFFRVTRNANTERDEEEADDLLAMIESELRDRRFAPIVRMEVGKGMDSAHRGMLAFELGLNEREDVFEVDGMLALRDLMELVSIENPALHDPAHRPTDHPALRTSRNIFHVIRDAGSLFVFHPYQSFSTSVARFLREASEDPKVRAIKMTLYRTSADAEIIHYLCDAARNGKQVAVVIELKARFDEAANIRFANKLEEFGIHVTYGVIGLKTHTKVILVVRQDYNGLRRYSHVGTGNYHPGTARLYADFGLLTCDDAIGQDLTELFNYLTTGYKLERSYRKLLPAPVALKKALLSKIEREMKLGAAGLIQFKMNALEDIQVTRALYRAAQTGVKVHLIVRDTCRLRPGMVGLSENVRVVSIVGRFLEHGRIYYFRNGGAEEYFIGSADCMKRNLESRVEVIAPIEDPLLRKDLRTILDIQLNTRRGAWELHSDGSYAPLAPANDLSPSAQELLTAYADKKLSVSERQRRRKIARRRNVGAQ
ncbi:MAG TPA: polyphosphate kinase 1 [Candidatus Binataceae bacterium]|nr:polyphosphate kinase 1 [Candidatus Binataceae bacterium]